jgi:molybdopterin converting factor subunit 1
MQVRVMQVRVILFAAAREQARSDDVSIEVAEEATIAEIRDALAAAVPALTKIIPHALWAVDRQHASEDTPVTRDSEIALIPPVSGG